MDPLPDTRSFPPSRQWDALADAVAAIAREAGAAIEVERAVGLAGIALADKSDGTPVSRADLAAHRVITGRLRALTPDWPVVSEEDLGVRPNQPLQGLFWLVDPLDGTKEFLAGNPEYTVNIALVRDGEPVLGVVQVPAAGMLYVGGPGRETWREAADGTRSGLRAGPPPDVGQPWQVVASRHHRDAATDAFMACLPRAQCISVGSSLKFCLVAEGIAHLYPRTGPTHEWDTAAAHAVLLGAGGQVVTGRGTPLRYGRPGTRNPAFLACGPDLAAIPPAALACLGD